MSSFCKGIVIIFKIEISCINWISFHWDHLKRLSSNLFRNVTFKNQYNFFMYAFACNLQLFKLGIESKVHTIIKHKLRVTCKIVLYETTVLFFRILTFVFFSRHFYLLVSALFAGMLVSQSGLQIFWFENKNKFQTW